MSSDAWGGELPAGYLARFRVDGELGRGGMGVVLRAFDRRLERAVALKRVHPERKSPKARARLWREARTLAALRHPSIVQLYDILEDEDGALILAMELVDGRPLSELVGEPWPIARAASLALRLARALGYAHRAGVVHRDVKASNVLVRSATSAIHVIDFGLARHVDDVSLTLDGGMVGTLSSMAPEQISGDAVGPPTDVYAVGCLLYELLVGSGPHARGRRDATVAAILAGAHAPLREARPDVPAALADLVERCLALAPADRPRDGDALAAELARVAARAGLDLDADAGPLADVPRVRRRGRRLALAAVVSSAVAGGIAAAAAISGGGAAHPCGPLPTVRCDPAVLACRLDRPPPAGLVLWLDAAHLDGVDASGPVARWPDRSPRADDLVQDDAARRPTLQCGALGGWPAVRADGVDDALATRSPFPLGGDPALTAFVVLRLRQNATRSAVVAGWGEPSWGGAGSQIQLRDGGVRWATGYFEDAAPPDGAFRPHLDRPTLLTLTRTRGAIGAATTLAYDGEAQTLTGPSLVPDIQGGPFTLGSWLGRQPASVDVAEVIVYDYALHEGARLEIACWLGAKYAIDVAGCGDAGKPLY